MPVQLEHDIIRGVYRIDACSVLNDSAEAERNMHWHRIWVW
jgi:hypothetical protein